jgi:hypothetical protein
VKSENIAPVDSIGHQRTHTTAAERWEEQRRLVMVVIAAYRAVQTLEPVIAFNADPDSRSRSNRWSPDSAHYKVDVENTVRRIIEAKAGHERPALWTAWANLLKDDGQLGNVEQRLIRLLSGSMYRKQLHPGLYFRPNPNRYGSRG